MKPPHFDYSVAESVDSAVRFLAENGTDTKVLAGGQSLVPMMNFRLARPSRLLDINRLGELAYVRRSSGGELHIGALTRQATLERARTVRLGWPLLSDALEFVAHPQIRNRGTVGGSLAHADAASELACVVLAYNGVLHLASRQGVRQVAASDFFVGQLMTALTPQELVVKIVLPSMPDFTGHGFCEYARRRGDFAFAGVAALITLDSQGVCARAALAALGAGETPFRAPAAEQALVGARDGDAADKEAARAIARASTPPSDVHGSSGYRRQVLEEMARRAIRDAWVRAQGGSNLVAQD